MSSTGRPASWQAVGWGGGGFYWACAFDPTRDGVVYLGGDVNGFYVSTDHGRNWRISNRGLGNYAVYGMAVDRRRPGALYLGTTGGLYSSTDFGGSWTSLATTSKLGIVAVRDVSIRSLATDAAGILYAGTPKNGLFRSDDHGATWRALLSGPPPIHSVAVSERDGRLLLVASGVGLRRSDDGGATWTAPKGPGTAIGVAIAPGDDRVAYAACGKEGVWRSADRGATWIQCAGVAAGYEARDLAVHSARADALAVIARKGWSGLFCASDDGGRTWREARTLRRDLAADPTLPEEGETPDISAPSSLARNPLHPDELFIAGNWRPAFSGDGGKTWEERDRGADISVVTDIRFAGGQTYVTSMDEGLMASGDGGGSWRQLLPRRYTAGLSGHQWRVAVVERPGGGSRVVATSSPWDRPINQIVFSDDGGKSFSVTGAGLPSRRPTRNAVWGEGYARALAADPSRPGRLYLGIDGDPEDGFEGGGAFISDDAGGTWRRLAGQPASRRMFYGLAVDPTRSNRLFWGATGEQGGVHRSRDAGATWERTTLPESWVFNLAVSVRGVVYAGGANLWRSRDHGDTWTKLTTFDGLAIVGLEIDPRREETIWLSRVSWGEDTAGGVYRTTDGGATWSDITLDLPYRKPLVLRFDPATSDLWAGGVGLYRIRQ